MGAVALVWLASGIRQVDSAREFAVVEGPLTLGRPILVDGPWALAPPGGARCARYATDAQEIALPGAAEAKLIDRRGLRYGFQGWITVRATPPRWRELHAAAAGEGLRGAVVSALREASSRPEGLPSLNSGGKSSGEALVPVITEALAARGLELRRLDLDALDYLMEDPAGWRDPRTKLLIVGLDGADWDVLDPLLAAGRLPNLAGLIERGARAKLLTLSPMLSPVIWTTIATGVEPSRHGILDFLIDDPGGSGRVPVTSAQRRVPTIWDLLGERGITSGVVGWWATWPAEPVEGYLITDRLAYQLFGFRADPNDAEGKTWPPELYTDVRQDVVEPAAVPWARVQRFLSGARADRGQFDREELELLDAFRTLLASGDSYVATADRLRRTFEPRFEAVYLEGTDTVAHLFMPYREPPLPGVEAVRRESFGAVVERYYELADAYLGRLLENRGSDWTVMVLSDHGFASDESRPRTADSRIGHGAAAQWHTRFGMLVLSGRNVRPGTRLREASVYDIAPTVLALFGVPIPQSWPGTALVEALDGRFLEDHPVRFTPQDPPRRGAPAGRTLTEGGQDDLMQKLESLGYIAPGGGREAGATTLRNNAGVALLGEGRLDEAEREFREGLRDDPGNAMLLVNLGITLRLRGRLPEAQAALRAARESAAAARLADFHLAQIAIDRGELDDAERILVAALEREPEAAELSNALGAVLEKRGDLAAAAERFEHAARCDPHSAAPRNNLGNLARRRGNNAEAEHWYLRAIEADPYFMGAYNNLALVYQDTGRIDKAIDLYVSALDRAPGNAVVINNLASLYFGRGDVAEARRLWERCLTVDPAYASPYNNLAGVAIAEGRLDDAEVLLRRALAIDGNYGDARINLAMVQHRRGRVDLCIQELRRAQSDPRARVQALYQAGLVALESGDVAAAVADLEAARDAAGRAAKPAILNALAEAYIRAGRDREAVAAWTESLGISPGQADVRARLRDAAVGAR